MGVKGKNPAGQLKVVFREATEKDVDSAAELVVRLKRLNGEFDPMLKVAQEASATAKKYVETALRSNASMVLLAEIGGKVVGVIKADLKDRLFYEPRTEGSIIEFYVLPEYRRGNVGRRMLEEAVKRLKAKGAEVITAEFPSQNRIASSFYEKLGFRAIINIYAKQY